MSSPVTLENLSAETLRPLIGTTIDVTLPSGERARAVLATVDERAPDPSLSRTPFSFLLKAPGGPEHPKQGMLQLHHKSLGDLAVFAVPIGRDGDIVTWNVVFN